MRFPEWLVKPVRDDVAVKLRALAIALALIILVVTAYLLISEISVQNEVGPLASPRHLRGMLQPAKPPTVDQIAEWMTFEYVDRVFRLQPDLLKATLGITDPRYPRLSIRRWAASVGIDSATALERVRLGVLDTQTK